MDLEEEYGKNRIAFKRCQRYYNIIAIFYIAAFGSMALFEIYSGVVGGSVASLIGFLISAATLAAGFGGVYIHRDILAIAAPFLASVNAFFLSIASFFIPVCILCTIVNLLTNSKYRWLEQQDGFPYFNVRYRDQEIDKSQWNIKDPYTQSYEELKKQNNNSQMDEL